MPSYFYRARDPDGRPHEGVEVASSEEEVLRTLSNARLVPVLIESRTAAGRSELGERVRQSVDRVRMRVKPSSVALFARQLSTMIAVGLPLVRSLRSICRDHHDRRLSKVLEQVADDVQKGDSLSAALARHPAAFDEVFVSLVQTGEMSGTLDTIMDQTATYLEKAEALRLRVEAALRYPVFIFTFAALILAAMIVKIVPMFASIYERFKVPLPLPTQIMLMTSKVVTTHLVWFALGLGVLVFGFWAWSQSERGRLLIDQAKFNVPLFGSLIRMYAITKFARTLGILTASGTQILHALRVMRPVPGNRVLVAGIDFVRAKVEQGTPLARSMGEAGVFPEMLVQMTSTGEETGQLDTMLMRTADFYEQRVTAAVDGLSSLIEPVAIVVLGGVIGVMLLALYLPIFNLGQAMRQGLGAP